MFHKQETLRGKRHDEAFFDIYGKDNCV